MPNENVLLIGSNVLEEGSFERKEIQRQDLLHLIHSRKWSPTLGGLTYYLHSDFSFIFLFGYGISITTLIHEINHQLSKEIIAISKAESCKNIITHGISHQSSDYIYEIINECMTMEIKNLFFEKWKQKNLQHYDYLFQEETRSVYLDIDASYGGIIQDFYHSLKDLIKDSLIRGEGQKIKRIINPEFYQTLNEEFLNIAIHLKKSPQQDDIILDEKDLPLCESSKLLLKKRLNEYYWYEQNLHSLYSKGKIS